MNDAELKKYTERITDRMNILRETAITLYEEPTDKMCVADLITAALHYGAVHSAYRKARAEEGWQ